jgi:hypothetical protein
VSVKTGNKATADGIMLADPWAGIRRTARSSHPVTKRSTESFARIADTSEATGPKGQDSFTIICRGVY